MSISQGNGPLTAGMAVGLGPDIADDDHSEALYDAHADGDTAVDRVEDPDDEDPDDLFNNDTIRE